MDTKALLLVGLGALAVYKLTRKRRNPMPKPPRLRVPKKLKAADRRALEKAKRISREFHGTPTEVVELSPEERKPLPRFMAVAGQLDEFTYSPPADSRHGDAAYSHQSGDRGPLAGKAKHKPLLAVDDKGRPVVVKDKSPMKLTERGFVG